MIMIYRFLIIIFSSTLISCYVYKPIEKPSKISHEASKKDEEKVTNRKKKENIILLTKDEAIQNLKNDAYYKVETTDNKSYKIRYKKSDQDSIYGHRKSNENKSISIAKENIERIKDRRFSKLNSDLITFPVIGILAVGLFVLIL
ncbi:MAG: hypothetical protein ACK5HU_05405 [Flavobacteriales bacterium]